MKLKQRTSEDIKKEVAELKQRLMILEHKELVEAKHREAIDVLVGRGGLYFEQAINIYTRESESNKRRGIRHLVKRVKIGNVTDKTVKLMYCEADGIIADIVTMKKSEAFYQLNSLNVVYNKIEELV